MKQSLGASTIAVLSLVSSGAAAQSHQTTDVEKRPITLVGCVQRESDYRRMHDSGKGGPLGLGGGRGDEYVLVNAFEITPGQAVPAGTDMSCSETAAAGDAYELEGRREKDLEPYVGRRVEISGTRGKAEVYVDSGRPTGGNASLGQDLRLFEVDVASFREPQMAEMTPMAPAPPAVAETPSAPEVPQQAEQAAPAYEPTQPVGTSGMAGAQARADLPRTATPMPFVGLLGLFSLAAGLGLRASRRHA